MIQFMVLGLPRSGTTWAANWLTTDRTLCIHDPIARYSFNELDSLRFGGRVVGISCTSAWTIPDKINRHEARKLVLERDMDDVNRSLSGMGMTTITDRCVNLFDKIEGFRVDYKDLFDPAVAPIIWAHLLPHIPFDEFRHKELCGFHVQPDLRVAAHDTSIAYRLVKNIREAINETQRV